jgi:hypothetical protein
LPLAPICTDVAPALTNDIVPLRAVYFNCVFSSSIKCPFRYVSITNALEGVSEVGFVKLLSRIIISLLLDDIITPMPIVKMLFVVLGANTYTIPFSIET